MHQQSARVKALQIVMLLVCAIFPDPTQSRCKFDEEADDGLAARRLPPHRCHDPDG
jgi:hypothetical protein